MTAILEVAPELARLLIAGSDRQALVTALQGVAEAEELLDGLARLEQPSWPVDLSPSAQGLLLDLAVRLERGAWVGAALAVQDELSKPMRKAVKRTAHALRSRAIAIPVPGAALGGAVHSSASRGAQRFRAARAFMTFPDGTGHRVAMVVMEEASGGNLNVQLILRDRAVLEIQASVTSGRETRELVSRWRQELGGRQSEVPPAWVAAEVLDAERQGRIEDPALRARLAKLRARLAKLAAEGSRVDGFPEASPEELAEGLRSVPRLFEHVAFSSWIPDRVSLGTFAERLEVALSSDLVVSESQRREQMVEARRRSIGDYLTSERRAELSRRLMISAALLVRLGDRGTALIVTAAARELDEEDVPSFVERMFTRVFEGRPESLEGEGAGVEAPASSILLPGQEHSPGKGGGLIL